MTIRADRDPRYYRRFLIIGTVVIGFALWALYDGKIGYPAQREVRHQAYHKLVDEGNEDTWPHLALSKDWPAEVPGTEEEIEHFEMSVKEQYVMAAVAGLIGLLVLGGVWRSLGRWVEASDSGITSSWGQSLDFDNVVSVDKRIWRSKGIAKVKYQDGGRTRRFVLDNFKFDRWKTTDILRALEAKIDPEKIVNGPPEPPPGQEDAGASTAAGESIPEPSVDQ